ncbi:MAG: N-acetylmuramoyl-L-alanine amidase [Deltaproteobacteria bacterium]|nr:N-acetylmuramoyl-L-alanine amidase [Deltaproteobacteria bacterium]
MVSPVRPTGRALFAAAALAGAFVAGCAQEYAPLPPSADDPDDQEAAASRGDVASSWALDGEALVSPTLAAPRGATRVGLLIELTAPGPMPAVEARLLSGGVANGDWTPLAVTWSEEDHHVAVADFAVAGDAAEIRIPAAALDAIRHLRWAAVVPADATDGDDSTGTHTAALRTELQGLGIVTREVWGAAATRCSSADGRRTRMAVHHTETPSDNPARQVRGIQRYHMDTRGWCDIGYHFLIGVDGTIYEGRPAELLGAHVAGQNTGTLGISFVGCFHSRGCDSYPPTHPPDAAIRIAGRLMGTLSRLYGVTLDAAHVMGHRDFPGASTDCPGDYLAERIPDLLDIGRTSTLGAPPPDDPPPDDPPPDEPPPAGASCAHSFGGTYANTACSASYQCCDGTWRPRTSGCGACLCVEETGAAGCTGPTAPPPEDPPPAECGGLGCGSCEETAGCDWCASLGACGAGGGACAWRGMVGAAACWTELWPCATASCWNPTETLTSCGTWTKNEDFSSGAYSVHRYWVRLPGTGRLTLRLERTGGTFAPALLVSDRSGRAAYGGDVAALHPDVTVSSATTGRSGTFAEVTLQASRDLDAYVYVTGWAILDGAFRGSLPTSSRYRLTATHDCSSPTDPPDDPPLPSGVYGGLTLGGSEIPRAGLSNPTLRATLGISTEPYGDVTAWGGADWVRGRISWFGGPADTGVSSTETGAVSGEVLRSLNNPLDPDAATLASRPEDYYFVAMRWSYSPNGVSWWRTARIAVTNPATGVQIVARPVDWGPNTSTRRIIDVSPQTMSELGATTDDEVLVAFAPAGTPLGRVAVP